MVASMTPEQRQVEEFHRATGATIGESPGIRDAKLRIDLIQEELEEFAEGCGYWPAGDEGANYYYMTSPDLLKAIDALCDLLYVVYGAGVTFGVDLEPFFNEVHRSNMTKVGGPVREDGKRLKPEGYEPPDLELILEHQKFQADRRTQFKVRDPLSMGCNSGLPGTECDGFGGRPHLSGPLCPEISWEMFQALTGRGGREYVDKYPEGKWGYDCPEPSCIVILETQADLDEHVASEEHVA